MLTYAEEEEDEEDLYDWFTFEQVHMLSDASVSIREHNLTCEDLTYEDEEEDL
jgi:hypothetical protein